MVWTQTAFDTRTEGRGARDITDRVQAIVRESGIHTGVAHVFLQHTSASLMLCENADSSVLADLETVMLRLAPDGDPEYRHRFEGDDDMPAHIRSVLTGNDISLPIAQGSLALGTWQGIYLWEHRYRAHTRRCVVTLNGQAG